MGTSLDDFPAIGTGIFYHSGARLQIIELYAGQHLLAHSGLAALFAARMDWTSLPKRACMLARDVTATTSVIALAWPLRRALGGGSAGIGPAHMMEAVMSKTQSPTPKLSDAQLVILGAVAQRADGSLLPFPQSLTVKGAALNKVVETLCKRKLAEERRTINGAPEWRRDEDGRPLGLFITNAGFSPLASRTRKRKRPRRRPQACPANARRQPHGRAAKLGRLRPPAPSGEQRLRKASRIW